MTKMAMFGNKNIKKESEVSVGMGVVFLEKIPGQPIFSLEKRQARVVNVHPAIDDTCKKCGSPSLKHTGVKPFRHPFVETKQTLDLDVTFPPKPEMRYIGGVEQLYDVPFGDGPNCWNFS